MAGTCPRRIAAALVAGVALLASGRARAFERQWHVGVGVGGGAFSGQRSLGLAVAGYGAYGISDMFDLHAQVLASAYDFGPPEATTLYSASAGLSYKIDIIRWVPWVDAQLGYYRFQGGPPPGSRHRDELGVSMGFGIDYALSRSFGLGAELRYHGFVRDLPTSLADTPYFTGLLRAEYTWGW